MRNLKVEKQNKLFEQRESFFFWASRETETRSSSSINRVQQVSFEAINHLFSGFTLKHYHGLTLCDHGSRIELIKQLRRKPCSW